MAASLLVVLSAQLLRRQDPAEAGGNYLRIVCSKYNEQLSRNYAGVGFLRYLNSASPQFDSQNC